MPFFRSGVSCEFSRVVRQNSPPAAAQVAQRVSPHPAREQRRAIERMTQPRSSKGVDGVAIAGLLTLLLLASAGVAVCC